jgi:hypothetical protein
LAHFDDPTIGNRHGYPPCDLRQRYLAQHERQSPTTFCSRDEAQVSDVAAGRCCVRPPDAIRSVRSMMVCKLPETAFLVRTRSFSVR